MTVPFDSLVSKRKLITIKVIPDEEVRKDPLVCSCNFKEILVSLLPSQLPFLSILEVKIISVIDFFYWCKETISAFLRKGMIVS